MGLKLKISNALYMIIAVSFIVTGLAYLLYPQIMPYHEQAIGRSWSELDSSLQILLRGMMKLISAGFFVSALSIIILLMGPFRKGEKWSKWAVAAVSFVYSGFLIYVTSEIAYHTGAMTPWPLSILLMAGTLIAFALSMLSERTSG
jgi:hypothetical protein